MTLLEQLQGYDNAFLRASTQCKPMGSRLCFMGQVVWGR